MELHTTINMEIKKMRVRTPNQEKALKWYCEKNNLKPQLSSHPVYYFINEYGKQVTANIQSIVREWDDDRKAKKKRGEGQLA